MFLAAQMAVQIRWSSHLKREVSLHDPDCASRDPHRHQLPTYGIGLHVEFRWPAHFITLFQLEGMGTIGKAKGLMQLGGKECGGRPRCWVLAPPHQLR